MYDENSFSSESFDDRSWLMGLVAAVERAAKSAGYVFTKISELFVTLAPSETTVTKRAR